MGMGKPHRTLIVEISEGAFLQNRRCLVIHRQDPIWITEYHFRYSSD